MADAATKEARSPLSGARSPRSGARPSSAARSPQSAASRPLSAKSLLSAAGKSQSASERPTSPAEEVEERLIAEDNLTPRVFEVVLKEAWLPKEEGEDSDEDLNLPGGGRKVKKRQKTQEEMRRYLLTPENLTSWEEVRITLMKLSAAEMQDFLRMRKIFPIPNGKERRLDMSVEHLRNLVQRIRQERLDIEAKGRADERRNNLEVASAVRLQCLARQWLSRRIVTRRRKLRAEMLERKRIATETAENWRVAQDQIQSAIVWLHGQGETEVGWQDLFHKCTTPEIAGIVRWLYPRADISPCTSRHGAYTCQWFDTPELPVCRLVRGIPDRKRLREDPNQIEEAIKKVNAVVDALIVEGVQSEHILLGGFGQGAAVVLHAVLRYSLPLAGAVLLSAWVPAFAELEIELKSPRTDANRGARLLWIHGARDSVVHLDVAASQAKALRKLGVQLDFRAYPELGFGTSANSVNGALDFMFNRLLASWGGPSDLPEAELTDDESSDEEFRLP